MENTVLMPIEGKQKFKFTGLSAPQLKILNENRNNIFKALAVFGGAYLAYETYKSVINISEEEWRELLPDQLEKLLAPFLDENIDVDECLSEPEIIINEIEEPEIINEETIAPHDDKDDVNEIVDHTGKAEEILEEHGIDEEIIEEITGNEDHTVIDEEMEEYINSNEFLTDLNDDSANEVIINDDYVENPEEIIFEEDIATSETAEILDEQDFDHNLIEEVTGNEDMEVDEDMMEYINSDDILIDLNEDSAEEIIINNEYIDSDEEIIIDDESEYGSLENDSGFFEDDDDWEEWDDDEEFDDIDLNDIPDNI